MEFKITKTPKQYGRNGLIKTGAGGGIYSYYSSSSNGGGVAITNYLPAYWNIDNNRFDVVDNVAFYSNNALWEFFQRETTTQQTTNEDGETINETINNDTLVVKILPNTITFGDGTETITTKHFKIEGNNLVTNYNIISNGEITAYGVGNGTTNGGNSGTSTIINIVDNLTSTSTIDALSANQGRILNEKINSANHTHSNKSVLDGITSSMVSEWNRSVGNIHTHTNKSVIDGITSSNITNWNTAFTNNHTHATNKNTEVYNLIMGNYGGIMANDTKKHIMRLSDGNVTLNANGRHLYLGGDTTQITYLPTYFDNGDGSTTAQWNSFNQNNLYMQMPLQIALQSHNNTKAPITTNSTNLCPSLNADLLDGCHSSSFVTNVGTNGDNITVTKGGNTTTTFKPQYAVKSRWLVDENNTTYLGLWERTVQIQGLGDSIYLGSQAYKNNNYSIYFVTNDGTADTEGKVYWNYINGSRFQTQVPHYIGMNEGSTQPPIYTNSTVMCTNLNANYVGGIKAEQLIKTSGDQTINGNITIKGNLNIEGTITASDDVIAYSTSLNQSLTSKIKSALQNVESATTIDEIKNILITLKNSI